MKESPRDAQWATIEKSANLSYEVYYEYIVSFSQQFSFFKSIRNICRPFTRVCKT